MSDITPIEAFNSCREMANQLAKWIEDEEAKGKTIFVTPSEALRDFANAIQKVFIHEGNELSS